MKEYNFKINGNDYTVSIANVDETTAEVLVNGTSFNVEFDSMGQPKKQATPQVAAMPGAASTSATPSGSQRPASVSKPAAAPSGAATPIKSPLPGVILDIKVKPGDTIKAGQTMFVLEAMKMENNIDSDREGVVQSVNVNRGDSVLEGDVLLTIG